MFAIEALIPKPNPIPNWLIKSIVLVPLLLGGLYAGIWLAAEPICWHCFHRGECLEGWSAVVSKYQCVSCGRRWKPLINLHRYRRVGCLDYYYWTQRYLASNWWRLLGSLNHWHSQCSAQLLLVWQKNRWVTNLYPLDTEALKGEIDHQLIDSHICKSVSSSSKKVKIRISLNTYM